MEEIKKLYVDGLNFSEQLCFVKKVWHIPTMEAGVKRFVSACRATGWEPTIFIDAGIESGEALEKWKTRREKEVLEAVKDVPHGTSSLMGDMFRENGVKVHYSPWNADNDDCLAYFAQRDGAAVLSNDIDFARYIGKTYEQFGSFGYGLRFGKETIILTSKKIDERRLPTPRELLKEEPKMIEKHPGFVCIRETGSFVRGSPCFATKFYGNLHAHVKSARRRFYYEMNLDNVIESWPEYKDGEVKWVKEKWNRDETRSSDIQLDGTSPEFEFKLICDIIKDRSIQVPEFSDCEKFNLYMAALLVVSELYAYRTDKTMLSFVRHLLDHSKLNDRNAELLAIEAEKNVPSTCRNWKADGSCKFGDKCIAFTGHFKCKCWRGKECKYRH